MPEPPPGPLRRFLDRHPADQPRIARAVGSLLGAGLVALAAIGFLIIWHLIRRGRMIRERLGPPRHVPLPQLAADPEPDPPPDDLEPTSRSGDSAPNP